MSERNDREAPSGLDAESGLPWQWPDWIVAAALGLLVVTTALLAAFNTSLHSRIDALNSRRSAVITPAGRSARDMVTALSLELDAMHQYTLELDPGALSDYREYAAGRREALAQLEALTPYLAGASDRLTFNLVRLTRSWEAAALDPIGLARLTAAERERRFADVRDAYRDILLQATAVEESLRAELDRTRSQIERVERSIWYFSLGLAALILVASMLVLWLFRRSRRLEHVAERRSTQVAAAMEDRGRLIRGISHDVKNPLSSADGNAQLLELGMVGRLTQDQKDIVARIRRGIGAALSIISDLVDLARAEANQLEVEMAPTDVGALLDQTAADYRYEAEAKGLALRIDVPPGLPMPLTDGNRVREIVANLLSNALKYTPSRGRVTLGASVQDAEPGRDGRRLAVSVADTGPGIAPDELDAIFEEFYRGRSLPGRPVGVGLGLAISRRIARLLGGDVTVQSEPGAGSVFTLWLPLDPHVQGRRAR